jgi:2-dehydro-3-deoxygluconokinase
MLEVTSTGFSSFHDEHELFGDADPEATCARLAEQGIAEVVVRNGAQPCVLHIGGERLKLPAPPAGQVVDTSGAGDAFDAAYIAARYLGHEPAEAVAAGHRLAAVTIAHRGALLPRREMPALAELLTANLADPGAD